MKVEEAIRIVKGDFGDTSDNPLCYLRSCTTDDCHKCIDEAFGMAINALSKAEKYRWHDLRKDPNDLPTDENNDETTWFECVHANHIYDGFYPAYQFSEGDWGEWVEQFSAITYGSLGADFIPLDKGFEPIIAWRYIEPFEGEGK